MDEKTFIFASQASIPDATQKRLLDRDARLPCTWQHPGPTESNSPQTTITLHHEQPVKRSFSDPRTDSEPGIRGPMRCPKKARRQVSFQRRITALSSPTCPLATCMLLGQEKAGRREASTGPEAPLLHASFSLQKLLQSC